MTPPSDRFREVGIEISHKYQKDRHMGRLEDRISKALSLAHTQGRESMRDEIIPIIFGKCGSDNVAQRTVEAIRNLKSKELE